MTPGTVIDHPTRTAACQRGELAARMVAVACEMACLVRDSDRQAIGEFLGNLSQEEVTALLVVQAAMIPVDVPASDLLAWVTWDEYAPAMPAVEEPAAGRQLKPCGTYAAFRRHENRGELIDDDCRAAATAYWDARYQSRKTRKRQAAEASPSAPALGEAVA